MGSWAQIAKTAAAPPAVTIDSAVVGQTKLAVIDANAIISGLRLESVAERFYTIQEVLNEVRDKQSRQFLSTLPYGIEAREPSEVAIKAVLRFARETGDIHALSAADIKLLALSYTLELAAHGTKHIREHPVQVRTKSKHRTKARPLPGWGRVPNPEDWKAVDEMPDDPKHAQEMSRIITQVQALDVGSSNTTAPVAAAGQAAPSTFDGLFNRLADSSTPQPAAAAAPGTLPLELPGPAFAAASTSIPAAPQQTSEGHGEEDQDDHDSHDDGDDDAGNADDRWNVVGKSKMAERRRRRKQARWQERQQQMYEEAASHFGRQLQAATLQQQPQQQQQQQQQAASVEAADPAESCAGSSSCDELDSGDELEIIEGYSEKEEEEVEEGSSVADATPSTSAPTEGTELQGDAGLPLPNVDSTVVTVTADFAMQNVLVQMGLRLVTRDGKQINRLSRWALRCSACSFVTKETGRLFCPRCGNMTVDRVEISVGPDGAEYYGVRKRHILRGTRFSLPKPKGGRSNNKQPIMHEDVLMQKVKPPKKKAADADGLDPFAPEFGADTWFQTQQLVGNKGVAAMMASWKRNPNERKHTTHSNRRKK